MKLFKRLGKKESKQEDLNRKKTLPCCKLIPGDNLETHTVTTEDGYLLTAFRLVNQSTEANKGEDKLKSCEDNKECYSEKTQALQVQIQIEPRSDCNNSNKDVEVEIEVPEAAISENKDKDKDKEVKSKPRIPVLLIPGLINGGKEWVFQTGSDRTRKNLPEMLDNEGYDCWMGCFRGSPHSREHATMKGSWRNKKFWDFSMDEIGNYDLPAFIDHILKTTGTEKLFFVGYSMGGALIMITLNLRPEYSSKISGMVLMAPAVYGYDYKTKTNKVTIPIYSKVARSRFIRRRMINKHPSATTFHKILAPCSCLKSRVDSFTGRMFKIVARLSGGSVKGDGTNLKTFIQVAGIMPASTSPKLACHVAQVFSSRKFRAFNYGRSGNLKRYEVAKPPRYFISQVTVPTATFTANHDYLVPASGVQRLSQELPNLISHNCISSQKFSHADFLFGKDTDKVLYPDIVQVFNSLKYGKWKGKVEEKERKNFISSSEVTNDSSSDNDAITAIAGNLACN